MRTKEILRGMIAEKIRTRWSAQVRTDVARDPELLRLMADSGCHTLFIGFESINPRTLEEYNKQQGMEDIISCIREVRFYGIHIHGMFVLGAETDDVETIHETVDFAKGLGIDTVQIMILTPLPGTRLWDQMKSEDRIALDTYPEDWKYYTLTFPVARYKRLSLEDVIEEMISCDRCFYSMPRVLRRVWDSLRQRRQPLITWVGNFSYRNNLRLNRKAYSDFKSYVEVKGRWNIRRQPQIV